MDISNTYIRYLCIFIACLFTWILSYNKCKFIDLELIHIYKNVMLDNKFFYSSDCINWPWLITILNLLYSIVYSYLVSYDWYLGYYWYDVLINFLNNYVSNDILSLFKTEEIDQVLIDEIPNNAQDEIKKVMEDIAKKREKLWSESNNLQEEYLNLNQNLSNNNIYFWIIALSSLTLISFLGYYGYNSFMESWTNEWNNQFLLEFDDIFGIKTSIENITSNTVLTSSPTLTPSPTLSETMSLATDSTITPGNITPKPVMGISLTPSTIDNIKDFTSITPNPVISSSTDITTTLIRPNLEVVNPISEPLINFED